ncbi:MAG: nidogen-like domain-containing protein [Bacteroidota bacterium]
MPNIRFQHIIISILFLCQMVSVYAQCPGLASKMVADETFENGLPTGWELNDPTDGGEWQLDDQKLGYYTNPGEGNWLYVNDEKQNNIGMASFVTETYDLTAFEEEAFLQLDLLFEDFMGKSYMKIELWDGEEWMEVFFQEQDFAGTIQLTLAGCLHEAVKFRFTYDDEEAWAWGMGIDNFKLFGYPPVCGDGICGKYEDEESCPGDCYTRNEVAPLWVPYGKDLEGISRSYQNFKQASMCDDCSEEISLPFAFDFFGKKYETVHLNSNGNLTFGLNFVEYTPDPFCLDGPMMVAPFFGDVDINDGGNINYLIDPQGHYIIINWMDVAYYGCGPGCDKTNTFQLILTDGQPSQINDERLPQGATVVFNYGDMQWTTGNSSNGTDGFGGSAATVGMNAGDGMLCNDYGTFDEEGYIYRGNSQDLQCPPNQVSHLDHISLILNGSNANFLQADDVIDIPAADPILLQYSGESPAIQIKWRMTSLDYTSEFVLFRGESREVMDEILRARPADIVSNDMGYYQLLDTLSSHSPSVYYLLKEIRTNGEANPSDILVVNNAVQAGPDPIEEEFELRGIGPNPFRDHLNVKYFNPDGKDLTYILTNEAGQAMVKGSIPGQQGLHSYQIDVPSLARGIYFMSVAHPNKRAGRKLISIGN